MQSMNKRLIFIILYTILLSLFSISVMAEKKEKSKQQESVKSVLKDARASIKSQRDQSKHVDALNKLMLREGLTSAEKSEIRITQAQLRLSENDAENMKAYLKQKYDTAKYFSTLLDACKYAIMCDSTDTLPNAKGKIAPLHRTRSRDILMRSRRNIYAGGLFFLRKNDFEKALPYLSMYIEETYEPLLKDANLVADTLLKRASFYATVSAYNIKNYRTALKYIDQAIAGATVKQAPDLQEYKVRCYEAVKDTTLWLKAMYDGCENWPRHDFFFTALMEYFENEKQYDYAIEVADTMLNRVQDIPLYWYAKSMMYMHKSDWARCEEMSDSVLARDSSHLDALYNKGVSIINQAMEFAETACYDIKNPKCRRDRLKLQEIYRRAEAPFERLRREQPDKKNRWAKALYRIYLHLNKGKEFAEIEKVVKEDTASN